MPTDPVFRGLMKDWLASLPAAERDQLFSEANAGQAPQGGGDKLPPAPKTLESVADGKALYARIAPQASSIDNTRSVPASAYFDYDRRPR